MDISPAKTRQTPSMFPIWGCDFAIISLKCLPAITPCKKPKQEQQKEMAHPYTVNHQIRRKGQGDIPVTSHLLFT